MKKILIVIIISLSLSSCNLFYGFNHDNGNKVKNLTIGMTKQEAMSVMGSHYEIESSSQEEDGLLEIIKYESGPLSTYLLHFLDGKLVVFEKDYPPYLPEQKITVKQEKE